jgi:putative transposase
MVQSSCAHRDTFGVESVCCVLRIAPSMYRRQQRTDPTRRSLRARREDALRPEIQRVWDANQQVLG